VADPATAEGIENVVADLRRTLYDLPGLAPHETFGLRADGYSPERHAAALQEINVSRRA
jgi:hypothetical protein